MDVHVHITWIPVTACSCFWQHSLLFALPVIQNLCQLLFFCHCPVASFVFTNWTGGRCVDARSTCGRSFSEEEGKSQHLGPFWKCNLRLNSSLAEGEVHTHYRHPRVNGWQQLPGAWPHRLTLGCPVAVNNLIVCWLVLVCLRHAREEELHDVIWPCYRSCDQLDILLLIWLFALNQNDFWLVMFRFKYMPYIYTAPVESLENEDF